MNDSTCSIVSGLAQSHSLQQPPYLIDETLFESPDPIASSTYHKPCKNSTENSLFEVQENSKNRSSSPLDILSSNTLQGVSGDLLQFSPEKVRCTSRPTSNAADNRTYLKTVVSEDNQQSFNMDFDNNDISMPEAKIDKKELNDLFANISGFTELDPELNESLERRSVSPKHSVFLSIQENEPLPKSDFVDNVEESCNLETVISTNNDAPPEDCNFLSNKERLSSRSNEAVDVSQRANLSQNRIVEEFSWNKSLTMSDFSKEFAPKSDFEKVDFMQREEEENRMQHQFIQEDAFRPSNANGYDTSTWSVAVTEDDFRVTKPDWVATSNGSRVSISTFLQSGSGPLGTLDSSSNNSVIVRPNFGKPIISPVNNPVTLMESLSKSLTTTRETNETDESCGSIVDCMSSDKTEEDDDDGNTTVSSMTSYADEAPKTSVSDCVVSKVQENLRENFPSEVFNKSKGASKQNMSISVQQPKLQNSTFSTPQHCTNNSTGDLMSLSAIGKLIGDMSLGANASRLAEVILKAKEDLSNARRKTESLNMTSVVNAAAAPITSVATKSDSIVAISTTKTPSDTARKRKLDVDEQQAQSLNVTSGVGSKSFVSPKRPEISLNQTTIKRVADKSIGKENRPTVPNNPKSDPTPSSSLHTTIFTNKRILGFGCVELGQKVTQLVSLQNRSNVEILQLKVYVKYDRDCFEVLNVDSNGCLLLHPNESFQMKVSFKPSVVKFYRDRIVLHTVSSLQKFCVPIIGYGGCAKLEIINLPAYKGSRYDVTVKSFDASQTSVKLILKNSGTSAAFFKTFVYSDVYCINLTKDDCVKINPSCGVIAENSQMVLDVVCSGQLKKVNGSNFLACVGIHWGEEITRRRLREWEKTKSKPVFVKGNKFTDVFIGESDVHCLYDSFDSAQPSLPEDARFFVGHLRECQIHLLAPEEYADDVSRSFFPLHVDDTVENESVLNPNTVCGRSRFQSAFSPPVKESCSPRSNKFSVEKSNQIRRNIFSSFKESVKPTTSGDCGITVLSKVVNFVDTPVGASDSVRVEFRNNSTVSNTLYFKTMNGPFSIRCPEYRLDARKLLRIPVYFEPSNVGKFVGLLKITVSNGQSFEIQLKGNTKLL